ncbi:MAG: hypothetical protein NT094_01075 [Candidatus Staskawiczbacteria bacterium]|nr:hypothetical protein [Candidatus Staskawiczbacteria bacterium]
MKSIYQTIISCILAIMLAAGFAFYVKAGSSFNQEINYEGKITDSSGIAVSDGDHCMKFLIYDTACNTAPCSGTELWSETWDGSGKVSTTSGLFSVLLGSHTSLTNIFNNSSLYLEVRFDPVCTGGNYSDSSPEIFLPRKQLGSVPSAFQADQLEGKTWEAPGTIGSTTPSLGIFTNITASGTGTFGFNSQITNGSEYIKFEDLAVDLSGWGIGTLNFPTITPSFNSTLNISALVIHGGFVFVGIDTESSGFVIANVDTTNNILNTANFGLNVISPGNTYVNLDNDFKLYDGVDYYNFTAGTITGGSIVGEVRAMISGSSYSGSTLDDYSTSGTYSGSTASTATYTIEIAANGEPDEIKWRKNSGAWSANIPIASPMTMSDGLEANFGSGTGHTVGDQWVVTVTFTTGAGIFDKVGIGDPTPDARLVADNGTVNYPYHYCSGTTSKICTDITDQGDCEAQQNNGNGNCNWNAGSCDGTSTLFPSAFDNQTSCERYSGFSWATTILDYTNWFKSGFKYTGIIGDIYVSGLGYASSTNNGDGGNAPGTAGLIGIGDATNSFGLNGIGENGGIGGIFYAINGGAGLAVLNADPNGVAIMSQQGLNLFIGSTFIGGSSDAVQLQVIGASDQTAHLQDWVNSNGDILASIDASGKLTAVGGVDPPYMLFDLQTRDQISNNFSQNIPLEKKGGAMMFFNADTKQMEFYIPVEGIFYDLLGNKIDESGTIGDGIVSGLKYTNIGSVVKNRIVTLKEIIVDNITAKTADITQVNIQRMQMVDQTTGEIYCTWISNGDWQKVKGNCLDVAPITVVKETENPLPSSEQATPTDQISQQLNDLSQQLTQPQEENQQLMPATPTDSIQEENPVAPVSDLIQNAASSLLNGVWNFIKWIIVSPIKRLFSLYLQSEISSHF